MTANVSIIVASRENTLRLPNSALRVRLPDSVAAAVGGGTPAAKAGPAASPAAAPTATPAPGGAGGGERRNREGGNTGNAEGGARRGGGGMFGGDMTPEQREQMRAVITELGITNMREATPEQREQLRKVLTERGIIPAAAAPGEVVITTRTIYRLPGGNKLATPQPVSVKVGITDGIASEIIDGSGVTEGDLIITGIAPVGAAGTSSAPAANPFGGGQRRF
jgi:HlyD family secretion protein